MRALFPIALMIAACSSGLAFAQAPLRTLPPVVGESQIGNYCLYGNQVYSTGSTMCVKRQGLVCVPPKSGVDTGGRAYWSTGIVEGTPKWSPPSANDCQ
jgi:hypothetical protein